MSYTFENLIEIVKERPEIWQHSHPRFCNSARRISWKEISKELNASETQLRKSWKYLVDQYRKELKAIIPHNNKTNVDEPIASDWAYFFHMSFLKDEIVTRQSRRVIKINPSSKKLIMDNLQLASSSSKRLKTTHVAQKDTPSDDHTESQSKNVIKQRKPRFFKFSNFKAANFTECNDKTLITWNKNPSVDISESLVASSIETQKKEKSKKSSSIKTQNKEKFTTDLILQKLDKIETDINDDDYMFFMSMLPMVKTLSLVNKLQFRMKVNEWLLQMMSVDVDPLRTFEEGFDTVDEENGDNHWYENVTDSKEDIKTEITVDEDGIET